MHKLQCLNVAKSYLSSTLFTSVRYLADHNYWRNSFKDQLQTNFKEWMLKKIQDDFGKDTKGEEFQDSVFKEQLDEITLAKEPIKKAIQYNIERKMKVRQIESTEKRTVHFLFNPTTPVKITPFTRKYVRLLDGTLEEFEREEADKFQSYIDRLENQELEENEQNPVVYETMPFFTCELTSLSRISFAVADDPFYKSERSKYYPEVLVISSKGKVLSRINPNHKESEKYGLDFQEDFREPQLKLNDDKKIRIALTTLAKKGRMVLLTVKTFDLRDKPAKEGEFDRAWFRLNNEDTNQTIDYKVIKTIEKPEGFEEDVPFDEAALEPNELPPARNECVYVAGRLFFDTNGRWVYESFNHCFTTDKYADPIGLMAQIYEKSEKELNYQTEAIQQAKDRQIALEEERKQAAAQKAAAAAKKKGGKGGAQNKKDAKEEEEEKKVVEEKPQVQVKRELDLFIPNDFKAALEEKIQRPFIFGPIEFGNLSVSELEQPFRHD